MTGRCKECSQSFRFIRNKRGGRQRTLCNVCRRENDLERRRRYHHGPAGQVTAAKYRASAKAKTVRAAYNEAHILKVAEWRDNAVEREKERTHAPRVCTWPDCGALYNGLNRRLTYCPAHRDEHRKNYEKSCLRVYPYSKKCGTLLCKNTFAIRRAAGANRRFCAECRKWNHEYSATKNQRQRSKQESAQRRAA